MAKPLRLLVITQNAPLYMGRFMDDLLSKTQANPDLEVVGFVVLSPIFQKSTLEEAKARFALYGVKDFCLMAGHILWAKLWDKLLGASNPFPEKSLQTVLNKWKIPTLAYQQPNSVDFQNFLKDNVDIAISVACPKILKKDTLDSAKLCSLNYHTGKLPKYRGRQPLFWAMLNGEEEVGITIHEMEPSLDAGAIVCQESIDIKGLRSLHRVYERTIAQGPRVLYEAILKVAKGDATRLNNPNDQASQHSFPTQKDGLTFRAKGCRVY